MNTSKTISTYDRVPPQAIQAEKAVLGSIMLDNEAVGQVLAILDSDAFYKGIHRKIYSAIHKLYEMSEPIDLITLADALKRAQLLEEVGGTYYLTELTEAVPSAANVEYHSKIVLEKFLLRRLIEESSSIARDCYEGQEDVFDIMDRSESRIFALSEKRIQKSYEHISPIMHTAFEKIEKFHGQEGSITGVASDYDDLDNLTSGFQESELIIIAGRPSMGKTAFVLNLARNAAVNHNVPVGFFSLEMSSESLAIRLLTAEARIDAHLLRTGKIKDDQWQQLSMRAGALAEAPIYIDDSPGITVLELRSKARRMKKEHNIGMIVIDYLQLMQGPKGVESRQQEISVISRSLKALAKELNVPVLALSQLSRAVEQRPDKRPLLSDLRESGAIEQDADMVMFVFRPEFYMKPEEAQAEGIDGKAEIIIGKQRNGPVGYVNLTFVKKYAKFESWTAREEF
ncbi:replicative DNA helicase [bacterium]|nr:replicative DNA helicase [bacterium]